MQPIAKSTTAQIEKKSRGLGRFISPALCAKLRTTAGWLLLTGDYTQNPRSGSMSVTGFITNGSNREGLKLSVTGLSGPVLSSRSDQPPSTSQVAHRTDEESKSAQFPYPDTKSHLARIGSA
jgi:hypothetical protein